MSAISIILGGVTIAAKLRDGSTEEVKVRQLPIDLIDQWAALQGDEAGLVELYCDRQDKLAAQRLRMLTTQELRLLNLINDAPADQFDALEEQLAKLRERILELTKIERWDSKLLPESHDEILRIGEELNRPIFDRWATDRTAAIGQIRESSAKLHASLSLESQQPAVSS